MAVGVWGGCMIRVWGGAGGLDAFVLSFVFEGWHPTQSTHLLYILTLSLVNARQTT